MSWSSVAMYSFTGTLTSPKVIEPFQMDRLTLLLVVGTRRAAPRTRATVSCALAFSLAVAWLFPERSLQNVSMAGPANEQHVTVDQHRIRLTNLDKVMYPYTGSSKAVVL